MVVISDLGATVAITKTAATFGAASLHDMLKRYAFSFYGAVVRMEELRNEARALASLGAYTTSNNLHAHKRDSVIACLKEMRTECETLDLIHTSSMISFAESEVQRKGDDYTYADLLKEIDTLSFSFAAELRRVSCFRIASEKDKYFETNDLFGLEVSKAFASCIGEIQAAGTCYALEQNEACVFHLMRTLERSLGVLASKFGVPFDHDNWHKIIEQLETRIRKMDAATFGPDWKEKQKFYARAANQFMFFKDAWRNHVMHVRDAFDEGRALSVYNSVKGFMQALAEGGLTE
jgi:hypothetical protein